MTFWTAPLWDNIMNFENDKKTFLEKLDKSKKGSVDEKLVHLLSVINSKDNYYTTSSCSGRVYFWRGTGRKNETEWLKVSHDLIDDNFFEMDKRFETGIIWLRMEPMILHVCCKDLQTANNLLEKVRTIFKKSCILSASNKIIVEIRGSEFIEMPFMKEGQKLFDGEASFLTQLVNQKLQNTWKKTDILKDIIPNTTKK